MALIDAPDERETPEDRRKMVLESLAIRKTLELRDDKLFAEAEKSVLEQQYRSRLMEDLVLTSEEAQRVANRSQEIYNGWIAERNKLGMGDYDTNYSQVV